MAELIVNNVASKATADAHYANTSNPHSVTKSQVGLSNVPNVDTTNPANITQDATHRFATDVEKATWNALIGGSVFQTTWNATTNSPALASGTGTKGFYYIVATAGSTNLDGITDWKVGDWAIFDGTVWRKVDNTDAVSSVNSLTGAVSLDTSNVPDTSNKRYVPDIALITIANQSGVNTGDNSTNSQYSGLAASKADVASPTFTGTVTTPAILVSSETASRVAIIDASKNVKSADTTTYPSLTEFAYVKGVTSAIQTQVDTKTAKLITANRQTDSYTLVLGDADKIIEMNKATANNLTVPLNSSVAYPIGTQLLLSQYGAGQTTVVATGGVTIRSSGGKLKLAAQYAGATLIKIASDEWYCFGDLTT